MIIECAMNVYGYVRLLNRPFRDGIQDGTSSRGSVVRSPRRRRSSGRESRRMTGQNSASTRVPAANLVGSTNERCDATEFSFRVAVHARFLRRRVLALNLIERDRHWIKLGQNFGDEQIRSTGIHGSSESRDESLVSTFEFFCIRVKRDHAFARVYHGRAPGDFATHRGARLIRAPFTTHFRRLRGRSTRFGHFSLFTHVFFLFTTSRCTPLVERAFVVAHEHDAIPWTILCDFRCCHDRFLILV